MDMIFFFALLLFKTINSHSKMLGNPDVPYLLERLLHLCYL